MSWISSEMMRDRSSGPFENYGEMLYAESLEAMQRKREKVGAGGPTCSLQKQQQLPCPLIESGQSMIQRLAW